MKSMQTENIKNKAHNFKQNWAEIVPVKDKYFHMVPNETKS